MAEESNKEKADRLLRNYAAGRCTPEEKAQVEMWLNHYYDQQPALPDADIKRLRVELDRRVLGGKRKRSNSWRFMAAAVLFLVSAGTAWWYFVRTEKQVQQQELTSVYGGDVPAGGNRATITLADGRTIDLDSAASGLLAQEQGAQISKTADGMVTYKAQQGAATAAFNTISTPHGGQYSVVLPDGSTVWLNAGSSLRYPTVFTGDKRKVELTGEAYFEVSHDASKPFLVSSGGQTVQVLGTTFDISAYADQQAVYTTLVSGSVRIDDAVSGRPLVTVRPNQRASYNGKELVVLPVDVAQYTAWREGDFRFRDTPLSEVLHQLERWYDLDIDYSRVPDAEVSAVLSRSRKLSTILSTIEKTTGVKFKIEERRLTVSR